MLTPVKVIKEFFESGENARKVEMAELKDLSPDERIELADAAAKVLGYSRHFEGGRVTYS